VRFIRTKLGLSQVYSIDNLLCFIFKCASKEGRELIVKHVCIPQMISNTSLLLNSTNSWTAGNAALVLAR
jgi:hypothetical protein